MLKTPAKAKPREEEMEAITVRMTKEEYNRVNVLMQFYRTNSMAHAIRLGIEDVVKGIEAGNVTESFRTKPIKTQPV